MSESSSFLSWEIGQTPNVPMMFLGFCCCCGFPLIALQHSFRNELKKAFPEIDDSMHWPSVIIGCWALYLNHVQLAVLEEKKGIKYQERIPWFLVFIPFLWVLWPLVVAENMKRLNALVNGNAEK